MIFRLATLADIPALSKIRLAVKENTLSDPTLISSAMYEQYLLHEGKGWLCEIEGKTTGFVIAAYPDHSIWALFVLPEYEGRGIGKQLLNLAIDHLFTMGATEIKLSTTPHTRADRFYAQQGWQRGIENKEVAYLLKRSI
ncbi:MAG: GNAT family N-acetyltransferase [Proteobacteria bacterium]|nr:GNAT family N-acetyltransferase [Pseudomonadota bacterium]